MFDFFSENTAFFFFKPPLEKKLFQILKRKIDPGDS